MQHNWIVRLDRIPDAAISSVRDQWRPNLDVLEVEMHLLGGLAFAYESKTADIHTEWVNDRNPPIRRVVRHISNTFWFFREVMRYGEDCILVSPELVLARLKQKLQAQCKQYGLIGLEDSGTG